MNNEPKEWAIEVRSLIEGGQALNPMYHEIWMQEIIDLISTTILKAEKRAREEMVRDILKNQYDYDGLNNKCVMVDEIKSYASSHGIDITS